MLIGLIIEASPNNALLKASLVFSGHIKPLSVKTESLEMLVSKICATNNCLAAFVSRVLE